MTLPKSFEPVRQPCGLKAALERDRLRGKAAPFRGVFVMAAVAALTREPNEAEAVIAAATAEQPPTQCPACGFPCSFPARAVSGEWTWNCQGGCNP